MKSPCVKDCPDRLPCGACRKSCEAFREYEAQRLEEKPWVDQANTAARERYVRQSARFAKAGGLSVYKQAAEEKCDLRVAMTDDELHGYLGHYQGHGWHISNLKIYDTPKELIEFHTWKKCKSCSKSGYESTACIYDENCMIPAAITKAPQSWCYVEEM